MKRNLAENRILELREEIQLLDDKAEDGFRHSVGQAIGSVVFGGASVYLGVEQETVPSIISGSFSVMLGWAASINCVIARANGSEADAQRIVLGNLENAVALQADSANSSQDPNASV